jgi:hypothetical protein
MKGYNVEPKSWAFMFLCGEKLEFVLAGLMR